MKKIFVGLMFALAFAAAWALPTVQQVEEQVRLGNYAQAESMMSEVVAARPDSARAHYIYAEILAHDRNFAKASQEAGKAKQIDPALAFTDPAKFRSFEQLLAQQQAPAVRSNVSTPTAITPAAISTSPGMPTWIWVLGFAIIAVIAWRAFSSRRAALLGGASGMAGGAYPQPMPGAPGAPYGAAPAAGGSGLLGTGLAVAGGVAGGMLIDEMLHRHQDSGATHAGGLQPGVYDAGQSNAAANELEQRQVDFGSGSDWDAGGGSSDAGSSDTSSWD